jgi:hypothetical protein
MSFEWRAFRVAAFDGPVEYMSEALQGAIDTDPAISARTFPLPSVPDCLDVSSRNLVERLTLEPDGRAIRGRNLDAANCGYVALHQLPAACPPAFLSNVLLEVLIAYIAEREPCIG